MNLAGILKSGIGVGLLMASTLTNGQTRTAIANGVFTDPAVWDCNCIPGATEDIVIDVALTINVSGTHTVNSLTINSNAIFTVNDTFNVTSLVSLTGAFNNSGIVYISGDLTNNGAVSGPGTYCVSGITTNTASMLGPMDFCDLSPPPSTPFVDNNTGFIQGNVLFCQNGICLTTGAGELKSKPSKIEVIQNDDYIQVILEDLDDHNLHLELIDLQGKVVWNQQMKGNNHSFKLGKELHGVYLYRLASPNEVLDQGKFFVN